MALREKFEWQTEQIQSESENSTTIYYCTFTTPYAQILSFCSSSLLQDLHHSRFQNITESFIPTKVALHLLMKILVNYFWSRNVKYLEPASICINILAGWRPCLSFVMVAQLSEADDVVRDIKRQWNDKNYWCQNIFISKMR